MALKKTSRYRKKTKRSFRRRYKKKNKMSFYKTPFSKTYACMLRIATHKLQDPSGVGNVAVSIFSANNLYDPDYAAGGNQPRGMDQLMLFYNHYTVVGAKITVMYSRAGNNVQSACGIALRSSATTEYLTDYIESRNRTYRIMSGTDEQTKKLSLTFSTKKYLGISHPLSSHILRGTTSDGPLEQAFFHVFYGPTNPTNDAGTKEVYIQIEYAVVFTERKTLTQS